MASTFLRLCLAVLCFSCDVLSLQTTSSGFDLQILNVSQTLDIDEALMTNDVVFTSSSRPDVEWRYCIDECVKTEGTVNYANGRGTASISVHPRATILHLRIGNFSVHFLRLELRFSGALDDMTQVLNTTSSFSSVGDGVTYSPDDTSFEITLTNPKSLAHGFSWFIYHWADNSKAIDLRLDYVSARGVYQGARDDILTYNQLTPSVQRVKTSEEESETRRLTVSPSAEQPNGYFTLTSRYVIDEGQSYIVREIEEERYVTIHQDSIPGPFPVNYTRMFVDRRQYGTSEICDVRCWRSFANGFEHAAIYKVADDGSKTEVPSDVSFMTPYRVYMITSANDNCARRAGNYLCQITTKEGVVAQHPVTLAIMTE